MGTVVDIKTKSNMVPFIGTYIVPPVTRQEYLDLCKKVLLEEDYKDILVGVMDFDMYNKIEPQLKKIVDCYYSNFKD